VGLPGITRKVGVDLLLEVIRSRGRYGWETALNLHCGVDTTAVAGRPGRPGETPSTFLNVPGGKQTWFPSIFDALERRVETRASLVSQALLRRVMQVCRHAGSVSVSAIETA